MRWLIPALATLTFGQSSLDETIKSITESVTREFFDSGAFCKDSGPDFSMKNIQPSYLEALEMAKNI
jgi:hypothetical protein